VIRYLLFDLDDTLYPRSSGVMDEIRRLMIRYLSERLDISEEEANTLRRHYFTTYGTTMRGLQINYHIDPDEYLSYVHNIALDRYLKANARLDEVLGSLPQTKVVFTNASRQHAGRVLDILGIRRHFDRIVDVRDLGYNCKPEPSAYQIICELIGARPEECLLIEDNMRNLEPAKALGMMTVLVPDNGTAPAGAEGVVDFVIPGIEEIGKVVAGLPRESVGSEGSPWTG
jgi:putative hydrolase of the HAD superfamily